MSAEVLREAAALMRRNAQFAEPGRWKTWGMQVMADPRGTSNVVDAIPVADGRTPSTSDRRLHTGNIDHIASWHPAVALAVADWLEAVAGRIEEIHDSLPFSARLTLNSLNVTAVDQALTVARTYLGSDQ